MPTNPRALCDSDLVLWLIVAAVRVNDRRWLLLRYRLLREIRRRGLSAEDVGRLRAQQAGATERELERRNV